MYNVLQGSVTTIQAIGCTTREQFIKITQVTATLEIIKEGDRATGNF
jgi:hypothetical protein